MKILHIDSSINGDHSASRAVSAAVVAQLQAGDPAAAVTYRDLAASPLPHLTLEGFAAADSQQALAEFLDADVVVLGTGYYNFSISSQLKAWIDRILVAGQTFTYTPNGPLGLASGKRVIVALGRGSLHDGTYPEFAESLLRSILGFIGIERIEFIVADGLKVSEDHRQQSLESALQRARAVTTDHIAA